jgi:hypothetical protein
MILGPGDTISFKSEPLELVAYDLETDYFSIEQSTIFCSNELKSGFIAKHRLKDGLRDVLRVNIIANNNRVIAYVKTECLIKSKTILIERRRTSKWFDVLES